MCYLLDRNLMHDVRTTVRAHYTNHTSVLVGKGEISELHFCSIKLEQLVNQSNETADRYQSGPRPSPSPGLRAVGPLNHHVHMHLFGKDGRKIVQPQPCVSPVARSRVAGFHP